MRWVLPVLMLAGCGTGPKDAPVNETDPAITDALNDPIMADPRLELQHGGGSVRVPVGVDAGEHAQTLGQIATARVREKSFAGCNPKIDYAFGWMARLPADLTLPTGATVSEAAGSEAGACHLRIVRYAIAKPAADLDAYYRKRGFAVSGSDGAISGIRAKDGAAFWVSFAPAKAGTSVDFVTNRGD
jgi:hypothetical protein